jgi:TetR/AcrR family transcriptional regulator, mexJK operon transcriptional repressor
MSAPRARPSKRDLLRDAARRLFLSRGYARTSTDLLAREAGVSKPTLYAYYRGKDELLVDVLRQFFEPALPSTMPALETRDDLGDALRGIATSAVERLMTPDYLGLLRVIIAEAPQHAALGELYRSTVPARIMDSVADLLGAAQEHGLVRAGDPRVPARLFVGAILSYAVFDGLFVLDGPPRRPEPKELDAVVALLLDAVS